MAINGDDFFWPQSPSTPVGKEGVTKREALAFFIAMGLTADLGDAVVHSNLKTELADRIADEVWSGTQKVLDADPTP